MIIPTMRDLILPEILFSLPPGDNLKGTVDENTVSDTFSSTLAILFGLAPTVTPYLSSAVLFGLLEFFGTCLNHSIALRACIPLKPEDKAVEKRLLPVLWRRL